MRTEKEWLELLHGEVSQLRQEVHSMSLLVKTLVDSVGGLVQQAQFLLGAPKRQPRKQSARKRSSP